MKLINDTKQHLKNSVSHYVGMRLKFRSAAFAGKATTAQQIPVEKSRTAIVRH